MNALIPEEKLQALVGRTSQSDVEYFKSLPIHRWYQFLEMDLKCNQEPYPEEILPIPIKQRTGTLHFPDYFRLHGFVGVSTRFKSLLETFEPYTHRFERFELTDVAGKNAWASYLCCAPETRLMVASSSKSQT